MKYEYCLYTVGRFYNEEYTLQHEQKPGAHYFASKEKRDAYKILLRLADEHLITDGFGLMMTEWEGEDARIPVTLHRTMIIDGYEITTHYDMAPVRDLESAICHMKEQWLPGYNDEPLGGDFDYCGVEIVKEWITGPFDTFVFGSEL